MKRMFFIAFIALATMGCDNEPQCIDESKINVEAICTMDYTPVCGCDGKTYSNACGAENAGLLSWADGECK